MKRLLSSPTVVNLELTEVCNVKCRHCYNFWRDESMGQASLDTEKLDTLIEKFVEAEVFHVVLTGGEPMSQFDLLEHGFRKLQENNISISCNSNLMLATDERCKRLSAVGLDHILTSLPSSDPVTNDYIMGQVGSFERIMTGIKAAVANNIRVSVNMVITKKNYHQVYETAKLVAEMGAQKLFTTRAVPPTYAHGETEDETTPSEEQTLFALDEAIRARDDFGIMIGTLVSYPLCFLKDLDKYKDYVGRGCPAQSGNLLSINATGDTHACVHEEQAYGNVFEKSLREVFQSEQLRSWHNGGYHFEGCKGCDYVDVCESGCAMTAMAAEGSHNRKDPLFVGPHVFTKHFQIVEDDPTLPEKILSGMSFIAPQRLRFRKEDGFYLLNIRWGNSMPVETEIAEFLMEHQKSKKSFTIADFGENRRNLLANLLYKDAVESPDTEIGDVRKLMGLSINLDALPAERLKVV
jgi:radical SAM protein with 4Fe4S-binding SPASM domain